MADDEQEPSDRSKKEGGNKPPTERAISVPENLPPPLVEALQSGNIERIAQVLSVTYSSSSFWSGPLPPASELKRYSDAVTNGGDRIVTNWEGESQHRRRLETRGQWLAFAIGVLGIPGGIACALLGQPWVGGSIAIATVLGLAAMGLLRRLIN